MNLFTHMFEIEAANILPSCFRIDPLWKKKSTFLLSCHDSIVSTISFFMTPQDFDRVYEITERIDIKYVFPHFRKTGIRQITEEYLGPSQTSMAELF